MKRKLWGALLGATMSLAATQAAAEDVAVVIGVGKYGNPDANLPGIEKDVAQVEGFAQRMGYRRVVVLRDGQATHAGIVAAMGSALAQAGPNDRVLIYFSGHGTQIPDVNGDEPDGLDEALVAYDFGSGRTPSGQSTFVNVVTDDEIGALLGQSKSQNVLLMIDACHSGTIDKAVSFDQPLLGNTVGYRKFLPVPGLGSRTKAFGVKPTGSNAGSVKYISLSAAADDQAATATATGSAFTVGLAKAIDNHSAEGSVTPVQLVREAQAFIDRFVSASQRFNPQIQGDPSLRDKAIILSDTSSGNGPNWTNAQNLVANLSRLKIEGVKARYADGELLRFAIETPSGGYLNVLSVNPDDTVTLLYPNKYNKDNKIGPGELNIPTAQMPFQLPAGAPFGKTMILAIVTNTPYSLLDSSVDGKDAPAPLATPSLGGLLDLKERAFSVAEKTEASAAGGPWGATVVTEVCSSSGQCR
jgi:hypothetical protein